MQKELFFIAKPLKSACLAVWSDKQTIKIILFLAAVQILGLLTGILFLPHGHAYTAGNILNKLLAWDGRHYLIIAQNGYIWDPTYCTTHFCNLAFFPLQGLIDRLFLFIFTPNVAIAAILLSSWALGVASIFYFARLARSVMGQGAGNAIFLYAMYPGSAFYLMGYPTGIILLTIILALHNALTQQWWRSALWIGLGSAAGSASIFIGLPIGIYYLFDQFKRYLILRAGFNSLGWASLALSGLLLFMAYQYISFSDATAFMAAQIPWTGSVTFATKISLLTTFHTYVASYLGYLYWYKFAFHTLLLQHGNEIIFLQNAKWHLCDFIQMVIQAGLNLFFFALAWTGVMSGVFFISGKKARILLCASSLCILFSYEWFILATNWSMESTIRLLFPAIAIFLGLGGLCYKFKFLEYGLFPFFTIVTFWQMASVTSGFIVT